MHSICTLPDNLPHKYNDKNKNKFGLMIVFYQQNI